jgi:hypothetical protein
MMILIALIGFIFSLIISGLIIFVSTKLLGEKEGFDTAIIAAFIGAILFGAIAIFLGTGWIAGLIGWIAWLLAIGNLYKIGWLKSFLVSVIIWCLTTILGLIIQLLA